MNEDSLERPTVKEAEKMNFLLNNKANDIELESIKQRNTMYVQSLSRKEERQKEMKKINMKLSDITGSYNNKNKKDRYLSINQSDKSRSYQKNDSVRLPLINNFVKKISVKQKVEIATKLSSILSKHDFSKL